MSHTDTQDTNGYAYPALFFFLFNSSQYTNDNQFCRHLLLIFIFISFSCFC